MFLAADAGYALQRLRRGEMQMAGAQLVIYHLAMEEKRVTPGSHTASPPMPARQVL